MKTKRAHKIVEKVGSTVTMWAIRELMDDATRDVIRRSVLGVVEEETRHPLYFAPIEAVKEFERYRP